jgi:hypothetical protein
MGCGNLKLKSEYNKPKLKVHGSLKDLTKGSQSGGGDQDTGSPPISQM